MKVELPAENADGGSYDEFVESLESTDGETYVEFMARTRGPDFNAENYNPSASVDDGSCYYANPIFDNVNLLFNWNNTELIQNSFGGVLRSL